MKKTPFLITALIIIASCNILAATQSLKESNDYLNLSLEDLLNVKVITSSKYLEKSVDSPANIHVITAKQINDRGYKNIEDLLRNLSGVDIQEYAVVGNYNVVTMRGAKNNNKFIILKDGVRISTPAGEINAISENYPLYLAKRVEILIGPASVNYGADAFAGVINIITFASDDEKKTNISLSVGGDNYLNGHALYSKVFSNGIYINAGIQGHYSQDYTFDKDYPELYSDINKNYSFKNTDSFQFFTDVKINKQFSAGIFHSKIIYSSDFTAKPSFSSFNNSFFEESSTSIYANVDYDFSDKIFSKTLFTYQLFTLGNATNFNNLFTGFIKQYKYGRTARYSINQDFTYNINRSHLISGGLVYDYFDIIPRSADLPTPYAVDRKADDQNLFYPNTELAISFFQHKNENLGAYIQDNWQMNTKWRQISGIRIDNHTLYGKTVNPRLTTIFQADPHNVFKLLYAHSFLAPPASHAFNSFGSLTGEKNEQGEWLSSPFAPFRVPNKSLLPETLKSLEFNYEHWFTPQSKIKYASYFNQINDVILVTNDDEAQQAIAGAHLIKTNSFKNIGKSKIYGIDIDVNLNISYQDSFLEYWLALSYIDGELTENDINTDLPLIAHYKIKSGLSYHYQNKYILSATMRWISKTTGNNLAFGSSNKRTEINSYYVIDLHGEAKITEQLSFKLTIDNLLDEKYYNAPFANDFLAFNKAPQLRRHIFATIQYDF